MSLVALLTAVCATPLAYAIPKRTGWVTDEAHVLTASERMALSAELETFERRTSHEIAVVLLSKLDGKSIEDESYAISRNWRVGKENKDDGVLLVLAMAEHQSRIEVGKGVGDRLTDIESAEILDQIVRPKMRDNKVADALNEGVLAIENKFEQGAGGEASTSVQHGDRPWWKTKTAFEVAIFWGIPLFFGLIFAAIRRRNKHLAAVAWLDELIEKDASARETYRKKLDAHLRDIDDWNSVASHERLPDLSDAIQRFEASLGEWDTHLRALKEGPEDLDDKHRKLADSGFDQACLTQDAAIEKALSETRARQQSKEIDAQRSERAMRRIDELRSEIEQTITRFSRENAAPFEREAANGLRTLVQELDRKARENTTSSLDSLPDLFRRRLTDLREKTSKLSTMLAAQSTGLTRIETAIQECEPSIDRCERERSGLIDAYPGRAVGPSPMKLMASLRSLRNEVQSRLGNKDTEAIEICARRIHESLDIERALRDQVAKIPTMRERIEKEIADENERDRLKREGKLDPTVSRQRVLDAKIGATPPAKQASTPDTRDESDRNLPDVGGGFEGGGSSSSADIGWNGGEADNSRGSDIGGGDSGGDVGGGDAGGSGGGGDFGGGGASSDW